MIKIHTLFFAALAAASLARADVSATEKSSLALPASGQLMLINVNGEVQVSTWEGDTVELTAIRTAKDVKTLDKIHVKVDAQDALLSIRTEFDDRAKGEVKYALQVPARTQLKKVYTNNGAIVVQGVSGDIDAANVNGAITIAARGGAVTAKTVNNHVEVTGASRKVAAQTVNGPVRVALTSYPASTSVQAASVNGRVTITVPGDASVALSATTKNGSVENAFGLPKAKRSLGGSAFAGQVGGGEASVKAETVNGDIDFQRT